MTPQTPPGTQIDAGYCSFLLRLWRSNQDGRPVWRASLESTTTGERHGFASTAALLAFLEAQAGAITLHGEENPFMSIAVSRALASRGEKERTDGG